MVGHQMPFFHRTLAVLSPLGSQEVIPSPFEWDEEKDRGSTALNTASVLKKPQASSTSPRLTALDTRQDYGEERLISYGSLGPRVVLVVVHTRRRGRTRLISARKANVKERQAYYESLERSAPDH